MIENQSEVAKKKIMLGYSKKYSLYYAGCLVHCVARLLNKPVLEVHEKLKAGGCFFADKTGDVCLLDLNKVPLVYSNLEYLGKQDFSQKKAVEVIKQAGGLIVEVDGNSIMEGTQQHFVFFTENGELEDPFDGIIRKTTYYKKIISIRIFKVVIEGMTEEQKRILDFLEGKTEGDVRQAFGCLTDNPRLLKEIDELKLTIADRDGQITGLKATISDQYKEMDKLNLKYGKLLDECNILIRKYEELVLEKSLQNDTVKDKTVIDLIKIIISKLFRSLKS